MGSFKVHLSLTGRAGGRLVDAALWQKREGVASFQHLARFSHEPKPAAGQISGVPSSYAAMRHRSAAKPEILKGEESCRTTSRPPVSWSSPRAGGGIRAGAV